MSDDHANPTDPTTLVEPRLPQELERIVFEMAARGDGHRALLLVLMQVARRVRDWLQPIVYETVVLQDPTFYQKSKSRLHHPPRFPSSQHAPHVRNLLVSNRTRHSDSEPDWKDILAQCHNLQDFAIWCDADPNTLQLLTSAVQSPLRTVSPHGLLRLSASLVELFPDGLADFNHEIFKDLTHLELLDFPTECGGQWVEGNNYGCLPKLRYLSIAYFDSGFSTALAMVKRCLDECKRLEVLIILEDDINVLELAYELLKGTRRVVNEDGSVEVVPEDRVVNYREHFVQGGQWAEAWYKGAITGDDFWAQSEKIVQRRRWRRELEWILWDSVVELDLDVNLGEWLINMEER